MSLFLSVIPVEEAQELVRQITTSTKKESISLKNAYLRVLAEDITAKEDIPGFSRSIVDGYGVLSADTTGAGESMPAMLECLGRVEMGTKSEYAIKSGQCVYLPTGAMLPEDCDAVAMIEYSERMDKDILIHRSMAKGENAIMQGEDFSEDVVAIKKGALLRPQECGVLAALGYESVEVFSKPRIGIISTGNEIVPVTKSPAPGEIRDVNSYLCGLSVSAEGGVPVYYGIVMDQPEELKKILEKAIAENDAVLISGGSSKDMRDATAYAIKELGEILVHGISIAPGKPTIIGKAGDVPVVGLPGHPASAFVVLKIIVSHMIGEMTGSQSILRICTSVLGNSIPSDQGKDEYIRVRIEDGHAIPIFGKSGLINTLSGSDGIVRVPVGSEGFEAGEQVRVILW